MSTTRPNADLLGELEQHMEDVNDKFAAYGETLRKAGDKRYAHYYWVCEVLDRLTEELTDTTNNFIKETK